jgi:outer membrane receptor protein involved in Fe transport
VADPPLSQVKAHTFEAGLRGRADVGGADLAWTLGLFRTETRDDIVLAASSVRGRGYFRNVGQTLRQGLEAGLEARAGPVTAYAAYAYTDATFRSPLTLNSPDNPSASRRGLIEVEPGDRMPGVARQRLKLGLGYDAGRWRIAGGVVASSGRPLFGDEAGLEPELDGYVAAHVEAAVRITGSVELFAAVENLADARYETFGTFTATDEVELVEAPGADNPRTLSPAPPRSWLAGLRLRF